MGKGKVLTLLSGGLDSTLAIKIMLEQGLDVEAVSFTTPFCLCDKCAVDAVGERYGIKIHRVFLGQEFLDLVANPPHGLGSGIRIGTLVKLTYGHVRKDLETGTVPIHIHVEKEITKGKYNDYDTFIGQEAVQFLRAYLDGRRNGGIRDKMPPEDLNDDSPLIRDDNCRTAKTITPSQVYNILHRLMAKAGLLGSKVGRRYSMRPHSIRKFKLTRARLFPIVIIVVRCNTSNTFTVNMGKERICLRTSQ